MKCPHCGKEIAHVYQSPPDKKRLTNIKYYQKHKQQLKETRIKKHNETGRW